MQLKTCITLKVSHNSLLQGLYSDNYNQYVNGQWSLCTMKPCWQLICNLSMKLFRKNLTDIQRPTYKETRYM